MERKLIYKSKYIYNIGAILVLSNFNDGTAYRGKSLKFFTRA